MNTILSLPNLKIVNDLAKTGKDDKENRSVPLCVKSAAPKLPSQSSCPLTSINLQFSHFVPKCFVSKKKTIFS